MLQMLHDHLKAKDKSWVQDIGTRYDTGGSKYQTSVQRVSSLSMFKSRKTYRHSLSDHGLQNCVQRLQLLARLAAPARKEIRQLQCSESKRLFDVLKQSRQKQVSLRICCRNMGELRYASLRDCHDLINKRSFCGGAGCGPYFDLMQICLA